MLIRPPEANGKEIRVYPHPTRQNRHGISTAVELPELHLHLLRMGPVVGVVDGDIVALRQLHPGVTGNIGPAVGLEFNQFDPRVRRCN